LILRQRVPPTARVDLFHIKVRVQKHNLFDGIDLEFPESIDEDDGGER
jgi:hypothetical protein